MSTSEKLRWYGLCEHCGWAGPNRFVDSDAKQDLLDHAAENGCPDVTEPEEAEDLMPHERAKINERRFSTVRRNLLTRRGYTPYCGNESCSVMPRTSFKAGQFECPRCGWRSGFEPDFLKLYLEFRKDGVIRCLVHWDALDDDGLCESCGHDLQDAVDLAEDDDS